LLDDRDPLEKVSFTRDSEKDCTAQSSDDEMEDGDSERARVTTSSLTMILRMKWMGLDILNQINQVMRRLLGLKTAKRVCQIKARRSSMCAVARWLNKRNRHVLSVKSVKKLKGVFG